MSTPAKLLQFMPSLRPLTQLRAGYLRSIEFAAIGLVILALGGVSYLFFNVLAVNNQRLDTLQNQSKQLRDQIDQINKQNERFEHLGISTQSVLDNLDEFNNRFLKEPMQGRLIMIDEVNKLIKKNNMNLQGAISFHSIQDADQAAALQEQLKRSGKTKPRRSSSALDIYPGLGTNFTVTGSYEDFRRLLYDLETNKLFIIIERLNLSTVELLQTVRNPQQANVQQNASNNLSIQFDIRVYFRKQ